MLSFLRGAYGRALTPVAVLLLRLGVSPSAVTVAGTVGVTAAALCLLIPTVGSAQGLPDFLQAVQTGLSEGLSAGSAAMEKDLTRSVTA